MQQMKPTTEKMQQLRRIRLSGGGAVRGLRLRRRVRDLEFGAVRSEGWRRTRVPAFGHSVRPD